MGLGINDEEDKTMKKIKTTIQTLAALLMAVAATTACSSEDNIADEPTPATTETPKTYTMTVTASKGDDAPTRALSIDGKTMNATWAAGDVIKVLKKDKRSTPAIFRDLGTLSATTVSADGLTATFTGSFADANVTAAGGLSEGDKLVLASPGNRLTSLSGLTFNYNGQDGALTKIATDYDYCMTSTMESKMVTVASVDGGVVTTTGTALFTNQQAIVRFTLMDADGDPIYPTSLDITVNGLENTYNPLAEYGMSPSGAKTLTLTSSGTTNVVYAAVRGFSSKDVTLTATLGSNTYTYTKSSVSFDNGKYYAIGVKMTASNASNAQISLASLTNNYTAQHGDKLSGTLPSDIHLSIAADATVTLEDVTISDASQAGITCSGTAIIKIVGTNSITSTAEFYPAIQAGGNGKTLVIQGSGSVTATGGKNAAGIGNGGNSTTCGNIIISGGTVKATGGAGGAGIGSSVNGTCGYIIINSGTITATGGRGAAGIGSGGAGKFASINITDGITSVTAKGDYWSLPIGKGDSDRGSGTVSIDGSTSWTAGTATTHLNFTVSTTTYENDTWTLTHK